MTYRKNLLVALFAMIATVIGVALLLAFPATPTPTPYPPVNGPPVTPGGTDPLIGLVAVGVGAFGGVLILAVRRQTSRKELELL